jgi:L-ascorbate metabolism protein UlaG (beta-lactamase superfamily)
LLLIEEKELRILTDPGTYSKNFEQLKNIDIILITHEHFDHLHIPALKVCLENNPKVKIFTNKDALNCIHINILIVFYKLINKLNN